MYTPLSFDYTSTSEYCSLCHQVNKLVGKNTSFEFSIIDSVESEEGFYVSHPDLASRKPVIEGNVQFYASYWRINETKSVSTPILENPTWADILIETNNLLEENKAGGIFLEALVITDQSKKLTKVELVFGS